MTTQPKKTRRQFNLNCKFDRTIMRALVSSERYKLNRVRLARTYMAITAYSFVFVFVSSEPNYSMSITATKLVGRAAPMENMQAIASP